MICHPVAKSIVFCFLFFGVLNKQNYLKLGIKYQVILSVVFGLLISGVAGKLYSEITNDESAPISASSQPAPTVDGIPPETPSNISDKDDDLRDGQPVESVAVPQVAEIEDDGAVGGYYLLNHGQFSSQGLSLDSVKKVAIGGKFSEIIN